jgi:hypothetical protein
VVFISRAGSPGEMVSLLAQVTASNKSYSLSTARYFHYYRNANIPPWSTGIWEGYLFCFYLAVENDVVKCKKKTVEIFIYYKLNKEEKI